MVVTSCRRRARESVLQTMNDTELSVAIGRSEAKLDALKEQVTNNSANHVAFQASVQDAVSNLSAVQERHETRLNGHDRELKNIRDDGQRSFTKSTVIIGLILTSVNIVFGIMSNLG